jgi:hypothetical protein
VPSAAESESSRFCAAPWDEKDDPEAWSEMSTSGGAGAGEWAVEAEVTFPGNVTVRQATPQRRVIAEITSIEWATHTDPDYAGELYDAGSSGGIQMHPDALTSGFPARPKVDVRVYVQPALAGIPIVMDWRDVDDASDHDGPIDDDPDPPDPNRPAERPFNPADNFDTPGMGSPSLSDTSPSTDANGQVRVTFGVGDIQPGNNFRVIAGARALQLGYVLPKAADAGSSVFYDDNDNGIWNAGEVTLDDEFSVEGCVATRELTIWRYLHVEVDSMGTDPPGYNFPADDLLRGDVADPELGGLVDAMRDAFVEVVGSTFDSSTTPWEHNFANLDDMESYMVGDFGQRGSVNESAPYWSAYVIGVYEAYEPTVRDNDPGTEEATFGATGSDEPEWTAIMQETLRDVANQWQWNAEEIERVRRAIVAHEVGHQFELDHTAFEDPPTHAMWCHKDDETEDLWTEVPFQYRESDLKQIREIEYP